MQLDASNTTSSSHGNPAVLASDKKKEFNSGTNELNNGTTTKSGAAISRHLSNNYCIVLGGIFVAITCYFLTTAMKRSIELYFDRNVFVIWNTNDVALPSTIISHNGDQENTNNFNSPLQFSWWENNDVCSEWDIFDINSSLHGDIPQRDVVEQTASSTSSTQQEQHEQMPKKINGRSSGSNGNGNRKKNGNGKNGRSKRHGSGNGKVKNRKSTRHASGDGCETDNDKPSKGNKNKKCIRQKLKLLQQQEQEQKKGSTAEPIIYLFALVFIYLLMKAMSDINQHYKLQTKDGKRVRRYSLQSYAQVHKQERRLSKTIPFRPPPKV